MKTINFGNHFEIYDDSLKVYDKLPPQSYVVRFEKMSGFYLEKYLDIEVNEEKIYGVHIEKINKVMRSFKAFDRNLGVILSGDKGIGKSLFAKMLNLEAVKNNLPCIIVDRYIPGIASYLERIEQEVVVMFDEFDKTFGEIKAADGSADPQTELLTLFDGMSSGKKMFVITCNELRNLNNYLINRPGRFHYHFRFNYPTPDEIKEYLTDKLAPEYYGEINGVVNFSGRVKLNYDCLRAIAFELNSGESFKSAIEDLNIIRDASINYQIVLTFKDHTPIIITEKTAIDLFSQKSFFYWCDDGSKYDHNIGVKFNTVGCIYDESIAANTIGAEKMSIIYDDYDGDTEVIEHLKNLTPDKLIIKKISDPPLHYIL